MKTLDRNSVARMVDGATSEIIYICQTYLGRTGKMDPSAVQKIETLQEELTALICKAIESSAYDRTLENEKLVRQYIFSDTHNEEDFSDIEICCEDDLDDAVERIDTYLEAFSSEDMAALADLIRSGAKFDLTEGGWSVNGRYYPERRNCR